MLTALRHLVLLGIFIVLPAALPAAAPQPANAPLMPLDQLQAGMQGEVWTVFRGTQPEPFTVKVSGVVRNALGPGKSLILCQLTDPRVQKMGAVAGMSGSPLYIDGKLVGALSYQVQKFETVRYAGFTPIADLLEVGRQVDVAARPDSIDRSSNRLTPKDASSGAELQPLSPVFVFGGVSPRVVDWLAPKFAALGLQVGGLGGQLPPPAPSAKPEASLQPGDAVAVAVATGDVTLAATGTVSYVNGRKILAFGHPMLGLGKVSLPMARSEIVTILPSNENSLKVANTGAIIGTIDEDRLSAVAGELGVMPVLLPVEIDVDGAGVPPRVLRLEVARHPQITPLAIGAGTAQAVMGSNLAGYSRGVSLRAEFIYANGQKLPASTVISGSAGVEQGLTDFVQDIGTLLQNPYSPVFPSRIVVRVEPLAADPLTTVESMQLSRRSLAPGDALHVTVAWRDYQGAAGQRVIAIPVLPEWQGQDLHVVVTNGPELDRLAGRSDRVRTARLRGFDAYLEFQRQARPPDGLYVAVIRRTEVFVDQTVLTRNLPGSFARIAQQADQTRYETRPAAEVLWESRLLPGRLVPGLMHEAFSVTN